MQREMRYLAYLADIPGAPENKDSVHRKLLRNLNDSHSREVEVWSLGLAMQDIHLGYFG